MARCQKGGKHEHKGAFVQEMALLCVALGRRVHESTLVKSHRPGHRKE